MSESEAVTREKMIDILFKEYDTLRTEILARSTQRISFLGLFGATTGYFLFRYQDLSTIQGMGMIFGMLFLFGVWVQLGNIINHCGTRIATIEQEINSLSGSGRELLEWESKNRSSIFSIFHRTITRQQYDNRQPGGAPDAAAPRR